MGLSKRSTKKNFNLGHAVDKVKNVFKKKTDFDGFDFEKSKPRDIDPEKWQILNDVLANAEKKCPGIAKMIKSGEVELIGIIERVTYHKMHNDENVPYTHVFEHPSILLKHKKTSTLLVYSEHIVYENKFIDG